MAKQNKKAGKMAPKLAGEKNMPRTDELSDSGEQKTHILQDSPRDEGLQMPDTHQEEEVRPTINLFNDDNYGQPSQRFLWFSEDSFEEEQLAQQSVNQVPDTTDNYDNSIVGSGQNQNSETQPYSCFEEAKTRLEKNNNIPKYLMRNIVHNFDKYKKKYFEPKTALAREVDRFIRQEKAGYEQKNFNNNLVSMKKFFDQSKESCDPRLRSFLMRKYAQDLIRDEIIPDLKTNNRVIPRTKKSYLVTLKIQAIRARNYYLMSRTQSR